MLYYFFRIQFLVIVIFLISCSKQEQQTEKVSAGNNFLWTEQISLDKIPSFSIKGSLNGKEFKAEYINMEFWRGTNDYVLYFGSKKPSQKCGYPGEDESAFRLIRKSSEFKTGTIVKDTFDKNVEGIIADFHYYLGKDNTQNTGAQWNCALEITEINEQTVKGRIALCFKDDAKSWLAGTFESIRCYY
jgi:hypothetical protein